MKKALAKVAAIAALATFGLVTGPVAASATTYDPGPQAVISDTTPAPGEAFTFAVEAEAFLAGETVNISITGENASAATLGALKLQVQTANLGTATANAAGGLDGVAITLPSNASGQYTVTATSASNPTGVSATVTVATQGGSGGEGDDEDSLPRTGFENQGLLGIWIGAGALLLAGGGITVATAVRRNRKAARDA